MSENKEKKWEIIYRDEPWFSSNADNKGEGIGFYEVKFSGCLYGFITKESWDKKCTGDILAFVELMLNDAHSLALKEHN